MTSIAFVSGSKLNDGIFRGNFQVYRAAKELGFAASWVQCIDPSDREGSYVGDQSIVGRRLLIPSVEQGLNRLWVFPGRLQTLSQDRVFLGDPTFLGFAKGTQGERTVVHVHDLRPLTTYGDRWDTRWMFRYAIPRLRTVRRIMVHTQFVRTALESLPGVRDQVYVLPPHSELSPRVAEDHLRASKERLARDDEVKVLYVATDRPYKNLGFFFRLAKALESETHPRYQFTLVSRLRNSSEAVLRRLRPTNLAILPFAPEVSPVYDHSDVVVFPSLYEGFGLPMLEGMSFGMPVIANSLEPMREVLGDGGLFAPAQDIPAWKELLLSLSDPQRYDSAARRAAERSRAYSTERFTEGLPGLFA